MSRGKSSKTRSRSSETPLRSLRRIVSRSDSDSLCASGTNQFSHVSSTVAEAFMAQSGRGGEARRAPASAGRAMSAKISGNSARSAGDQR